MNREIRISKLASSLAMFCLAEANKRKVNQCDFAHSQNNSDKNYKKGCSGCEGYDVLCPDYFYSSMMAENSYQYFLDEYKKVLTQAVNVLGNISGVTQFNRVFREIQSRRDRLEKEMDERGFPLDALISGEFLRLDFSLHCLRTKLFYRQLSREEVA